MNLYSIFHVLNCDFANFFRRFWHGPTPPIKNHPQTQSFCRFLTLGERDGSCRTYQTDQTHEGVESNEEQGSCTTEEMVKNQDSGNKIGSQKVEVAGSRSRSRRYRPKNVLFRPIRIIKIYVSAFVHLYMPSVTTSPRHLRKSKKKQAERGDLVFFIKN